MRVSVHTFDGDSFAVHEVGSMFAVALSNTLVKAKIRYGADLRAENTVTTVYLTVPAIKALAEAAGLIPGEGTHVE